jgi:hypothetical protein
VVVCLTTTLPPGTTDRVLERMFPKPNPFRFDPVGWARERRGAFLWSKQREIAESVCQNRYTAVKSCHGIGKSYTGGGVVIPWWMDVHAAGSARVISTAPSQTQVEAILWNEISTAHAQAEIKGRITHGQIPMWKVGSEIYGFGRKPADLVNEDQARQAFQGIHADFVLVVLDEACGIPGWLWEAIDSLVTNDECRVLAIGNPDDPLSQFKTVCQEGSGWNVITVSAFDSPNFTDEVVPESVRAKLVSRTWVEERRARWGEDSPLWRSKVLGEFPIDSTDGVIPVSWASHCWQPLTDTATTPNDLGVDVGAGGDASVIVHRLGSRLRVVHTDHHPDTMKTTGEVVRLIRETGATRAKVDVIGIGQGVVDRLRELKRAGHKNLKNCDIVPVNVGETSTEPDRFPKLRDELWWVIGREMSEGRAWDLSEMPEELLLELTTPKYKIDSAGRVKVESKDETRRRLGRSPDTADASLLAWFGGKAAKRWRMV